MTEEKEHNKSSKLAPNVKVLMSNLLKSFIPVRFYKSINNTSTISKRTEIIAAS